MHIIVTDAERRDVAAVENFELDLAYGIGENPENDFELRLLDGTRLTEGCLAYIDGTPWGGVVDRMTFDTDSGDVAYAGRTWQGVLAGKVVKPPSGSEHYRMEGEAHAAIAALISHVGLGDFATVPAEPSGFQLASDLDRFCTAWDGLVDALGAAGARPGLRYEGGRLVVSAVPSATWGDAVDSDVIDFSGERDWLPVNHLVCAGEGQGGERVAVDLYADASGEVSRIQSLFGLDERAELYSFSSADESQLVEDGTKRLLSYQAQGELAVDVPDGTLDMEVGDRVVGREQSLGVTVEATIIKKVVSATGAGATVSHEAGGAAGRWEGA